MILTDTAKPELARPSTTVSMADTPLISALKSPRECVFIDCGSAEGARVVVDAQAARALADGGCFQLPPVYPEWLGDRGFTTIHKTRFPYVVGEMARGIATPEMVIAAARAGLLGFYGSAGLPLHDVRAGIATIKAGLPSPRSAWGANLIHSPQQPGLEKAVVDLFLETQVERVSASAFMHLSPEIVRYSAQGLRRTADRTERYTPVFSKVSRVDVAETFMSPPPADLLRQLVSGHAISP